MEAAELAFLASIGSVTTAALGLIVSFLALRLSAASAPLDFRLILETEPTKFGYPREQTYWLRGRLDNVGASCKVVDFRVINWESPSRIPPGQEPYTAKRDSQKTHPRPMAQWKAERPLGLDYVSRQNARAEGLFYPRKMATGTDCPVHVWIPSNVEKVELAVEVAHIFTARRSHNFWVDNPLFDSRTRSDS